MIAANTPLPLTYRVPGMKALSDRPRLVLHYQPRVTAEDIRIHSWINQRLAAVDRERNTLWAKVKRGDVLGVFGLR